MSEKLIKRKLNVSVCLTNEAGARVNLSPGDTYDFTEDEIAQITAGNPNALSNQATVDLDASTVVDVAGKGGKKTGAKAPAPGPAVSSDL